MSEELQKPPVVDFDALLNPISEESPSGEYMRYGTLYSDITEARRSDDNLNQGDWQTELKVADYRRVIDLATEALSKQTKDIQVAAWLSESLAMQYGFAGVRDGMRLVKLLLYDYWGTLHPEIEDGDMEGRANAISWMDAQLAFAVKKCPITQGPGYSFFDWEDAKRFSMPDNFDSLDSEAQERIRAAQARAESEGRINGDKWKAARAQTRRKFCEETNSAIEECWEEYKALNQQIEECFDRNQMPGMGQLSKALDEVHTQVKKILADKRAEEPDPSDVEEYDNGEVDESGQPRTGGGGTVAGRADALRKLSEIAAYFQRTEPHSPVAYLVQRAVKWGNMPLDSWLQDVIKDENVLGHLRETLGVASDHSVSYDSGSYDSGGYESTEATEETTASSDDW